MSTTPVLMAFNTDPCQTHWHAMQTLRAVQHLNNNGIAAAVLTKGIHISPRLGEYTGNVFGVTLTFCIEETAEWWEPGAAPWYWRMDALTAAMERGLRTMVSFEPVICPDQTLTLLDLVISIGVNDIRLGHWNHAGEFPESSDINWLDFHNKAVGMLQAAGYEESRSGDKIYMIKQDLKRAVGVA